MKITIVCAETKQEITDNNFLMTEAGLHPGMKFEGVGIQDDGTPVVFDRCGTFGYLDSNKYHAVINLNEDW